MRLFSADRCNILQGAWKDVQDGYLDICYKDGATKGFMTEIIKTGRDYSPLERTGSPRTLQFVVLALQSREHIEHNTGRGTPYIELCLMDGNHAVFRGRLHSRLTNLVSCNKAYFEPGTIVSVADY